MEEHEVLCAYLVRDPRPFEPRAVAPPFFLAEQLLRGVLGVVDKNVGSASQLAHAPVVNRRAGLRVRGEYEDASVGLDPVAHTLLGVVEGCGTYDRAVQVDGMLIQIV